MKMEREELKKKTAEAIEFIESETIKEHLRELIKRDEFVLTEEEMCTVVYNSEADIDMKQAFFLEFPELPLAIDIIKRYETVKVYVQEKHEDEVYVLMINNQMSGVYYLFSSAKNDFDDLKEEISDSADIWIEMYDANDSKFRGRIRLDKNFSICQFDFSLDVIKENLKWNNEDTDKCIDKYIRIPHPFEDGDLVSVKGGFDIYRIVNSVLPLEDKDKTLYYSDLKLEVVAVDDDELDDIDEYGEYEDTDKTSDKNDDGMIHDDVILTDKQMEGLNKSINLNEEKVFADLLGLEFY